MVTAIGGLTYLWLLSRSWVGRDQILLLRLGEDLVLTGTLSPMAKAMSGGGTIPGSLLQILIGLPLYVWQDYRAPLILVGLFNFLAGLILYRVIKKETDGQTALIYFALYWLSPWRIYHAALFWEPAYLLLPSALHLWACSKLQKEKIWLPSAVLGMVLLLTPQLHGSFLFLSILTALLVFKKKIRIQWAGFAIGSILGSLTLVPFAIAFITQTLPSSLPSEGFIGRGFLFVYPALKGAIFFLRLPTLDISEAFKEIIYFDRPIAAPTMILLRLVQVLLTLTIAISLRIAWEYLKGWRKKGETATKYSWLEAYAGYSAIALIIAAGLAPFDLQSWQVIIALHAALIPFAIWITRIIRRYGRRAEFAFVAYCLLGVVSILIIGLGKPSFRKEAIPREVLKAPTVTKLLPPNLPLERQ